MKCVKQIAYNDNADCTDTNKQSEQLWFHSFSQHDKGVLCTRGGSLRSLRTRVTGCRFVFWKDEQVGSSEHGLEGTGKLVKESTP